MARPGRGRRCSPPRSGCCQVRCTTDWSLTPGIFCCSTVAGGLLWTGTMDKESTATLYEHWVRSIRILTQDQKTALDYREMRANLAAAVATVILRATTGTSSHPGSDGLLGNRVVYGVWLGGHEPNCPVYIGQTNDGSRRLWDLPVGESHHLANTFPPEIWSHVVVVRWPEVLRAYGNSLGMGSYDFDNIGLALEHALQREFEPIMNVWRKSRDGNLVPVRVGASKSTGAIVASSNEFQEFFHYFMSVWTELRNCDSGSSEWETCDYGGVAFPSRVYRRILSERGYNQS